MTEPEQSGAGSSPDSGAAPGLPRRPRARRPGRRRLLLGAGAAAIVAALVLGWALPNVAGPMFVEVRVLAAAGPARTAPGPSIAIGGRPAVRADTIQVGIEVVNHYPLSVVLGVSGSAFQAAIYLRDDSGHLQRVWAGNSDDPALEEGSDSPAGGAPGSGAAVVPSGVTRPDLGGSLVFELTDSTGAAVVKSGVYYLRVWAYGIASSMVPIAIDGGLDPAGPSAAPSVAY